MQGSGAGGAEEMKSPNWQSFHEGKKLLVIN